MKETSYRIIDKVAVIGKMDSARKTVTKELNIVSINGKPAALDLRRWAQTPNGNVTPMGGVALNNGEARALFRALKKYLKEG